MRKEKLIKSGILLLLLIGPLIGNAQSISQLDSIQWEYYLQGNMDSSLVVNHQIKDLLVKEGKENSEEFIDNDLMGIGTLINMSLRDTAKVLLDETAEILESIPASPKKEHLDYRIDLLNAEITYANEDYDSTKYWLGKLASKQGSVKSRIRAKILDAWVLTYYDQTDSAIVVLEEAITLLGESDDNYVNEATTIYFSRAVANFHSGNIKKAITDFEHVITLYEKNGYTKSTDYVNTLSQLAMTYRWDSQLEKCLNTNLKTLELADAYLPPESELIGVLLNNTGMVYSSLSDYSNASYYFKKGIARAENLDLSKQNMAYLTMNLAMVYKSTEQLDSAEFYLLKAKTYFDELYPNEDHRMNAVVVKELGYLYKKMGQSQKAKEYMLLAREMYEKSVGTDHPLYSTLMRGLTDLSIEEKEYGQAEEYILQAIEIDKRKGSVHTVAGGSLKSLGDLYVLMGKYPEAEKSYLEARTNFYDHYKDFFAFLSESAKQKALMGMEYRFIWELSLPFYTDSVSEEFARALYDNELILKGLILESSIDLAGILRNTDDPNLLQNYENWKDLKQDLSDELTRADPNEEQISQLRREIDFVETYLIQNSREFSNMNKHFTVSSQMVQSKLKEDEVAIEFVQFEMPYSLAKDSTLISAIILKSEGPPTYVNLCEKKDLGKLLKNDMERNTAYVERIYGNAQRGASLAGEASKTIYELLWEPMAPELKDVSTIYMATAGMLHRINFNAIADGPTTVLADRYNIVRVESTRQLIESDSKIRAENIDEALLVGGLNYDITEELIAGIDVSDSDLALRAANDDVVFSTRDSTLRGGRESFNYLPYTEAEISSISRIMESVNIQPIVLSGELGTEEALYSTIDKELLNSNIIHFSTHGFFYEDVEGSTNIFQSAANPMIRSGLILAGANYAWKEGTPHMDAIEDGVLTAYEIAQLNLKNTELVVLSACETGLGDINNSEGVYGLQRAFKIAGVDYILMSLWQVPDKQTKIMMDSFYKHWLEEGKDIETAFDDAQKELRAFFDTYNWAGFVLVR